MATKSCPVCASEFRCGAKEGDQSCWCESIPVKPGRMLGGCQCPACTESRLNRWIDDAMRIKGLKGVTKIAGRYEHKVGPVEHLDFRIEGGDFVLSRWFHLKRGSCCKKGCRNCPYPSDECRPSD